MTPSEAPKALQASECSELLDPTRANCWISAQHQPGKFTGIGCETFDLADKRKLRALRAMAVLAFAAVAAIESAAACGLQGKLAADARRDWLLSLGRSPHKIYKNDLDDQT